MKTATAQKIHLNLSIGAFQSDPTEPINDLMEIFFPLIIFLAGQEVQRSGLASRQHLQIWQDSFPTGRFSRADTPFLVFVFNKQPVKPARTPPWSFRPVTNTLHLPVTPHFTVRRVCLPSTPSFLPDSIFLATWQKAGRCAVMCRAVCEHVVHDREALRGCVCEQKGVHVIPYSSGSINISCRQMGEKGGAACASECVSSCVWAKHKVGHCLVTSTLLLLFSVFRRVSMFYFCSESSWAKKTAKLRNGGSWQVAKQSEEKQATSDVCIGHRKC